MREDSWSKGRGFKSPHHTLNGHFSHLFVAQIVMLVWKDENKRKRGRGWATFFKKITTTWSTNLSSESNEGLDENCRLGVDVGAPDDLGPFQRLVVLKIKLLCKSLKAILQLKEAFWKTDQIRPRLIYFCSFHKTKYSPNLIINHKSVRMCAWDSNPGRQDGRRRRIHLAMAAPQERTLAQWRKKT